MSETQHPSETLIREFLAWVSARPRTYAETMEAWRTSCPRHSVWEDALLDELVEVRTGDAGNSSIVSLTQRGRARLARSDPGIRR
jgi:hypothetical protein